MLVTKKKAFEVEEKDKDYLKPKGEWKLVDSDTIIYQTDSKGKKIRWGYQII